MNQKETNNENKKRKSSTKENRMNLKKKKKETKISMNIPKENQEKFFYVSLFFILFYFSLFNFVLYVCDYLHPLVFKDAFELVHSLAINIVSQLELVVHVHQRAPKKN